MLGILRVIIVVVILIIVVVVEGFTGSLWLNLSGIGGVGEYRGQLEGFTGSLWLNLSGTGGERGIREDGRGSQGVFG